MVNLVVCSAAEIDYTEALRWYAEHSLDAANDFDSEFDRAIAEIAKHPNGFPSCDERHRFFLMRRFPYQIIYRTQENDVVVVAVAHTSRAPNYWSGR